MPGLVLPEDQPPPPPLISPPPPPPDAAATTMRPPTTPSTPTKPSSPKSTPKRPNSASPGTVRRSTAPPTPRRASLEPPSLLRKSLPNSETLSVAAAALDNPDLGPFLLKLARDAAHDNPKKALDYASRAAKSFELNSIPGEPSLDLVMSLHVVSSLETALGNLDSAAASLERSVEIPVPDLGIDHALAAFSGYMQLGDTLAMLGRTEKSLESYNSGLRIQKNALGESDPRVAETCRYVAEAFVAAMQFPEAEELCNQALEIHRTQNTGSLEEAGDRRLMALISDARGDYESALENLVLSGMALSSAASDSGHEGEIASVDRSIGDTYFSLGRYDEAVFSYQKALTVFKSTSGDNNPAVAAVYVRLAHLYFRTGKLREAKSYCENAMRIYNSRQFPLDDPEEVAGGLAEVAAVYEAMSEYDEGLKVLQKAVGMLDGRPGQRGAIAGLDAQMGVLHFMSGRFEESYECFGSAVEKMREGGGERRSVLFGMVLNQLGLVCVQLFAIDEAVKFFEEAKAIMEKELGAQHPDALGICSNLAAAYDAMGRVEDAIEMLEFILSVREESLGTANPDVDDEKKRLSELLKEVGRGRKNKAKSLETLLDSKVRRGKRGGGRWASFGFRS